MKDKAEYLARRGVLRRARRKADPEKYRERDNRYRQKRRAEINATRRARRKADPEKVRAQDRRTRQKREAEETEAQKVERLARRSRYREANPERFQELGRRYREGHRPQLRDAAATSQRGRQDRTTPTAKKAGQLWTGAEMDIAMRDDVPVEYLAALLGRTYHAVCALRYRVAHDPKYRNAAGVR